MKHLPKHIRPRWRYLAVHLETWPDARLDRGTFQRHVWYAAQNLHGDPGGADLDMKVIRFAFDDGIGHAIVRTRRGEEDRARAALACLHEIDGESVGVRVAGISGTVRACEEKYIGRRRVKPTQRKVVFAGADATAVERGSRVDVRLDGAFVGATELDLE
ncbi:Rpp14/Pop5 family protein [Haladaptatus sp. GCM10025707]|uniref:Rpp14/Pop5 family protein n=1 Tax=unclassified Haladaptatus TaxID=2622732 RepID=UPI0023E7737D|nr:MULTISPECIES: Rpp14/Pop5 family protein [unclassified Haladaptatus]